MLLARLNLADRIIVSILASIFFSSSTGGGFFVVLKPCVSFLELEVPGLRRMELGILCRNSVPSLFHVVRK